MEQNDEKDENLCDKLLFTSEFVYTVSPKPAGYSHFAILNRMPSGVTSFLLSSDYDSSI